MKHPFDQQAVSSAQLAHHDFDGIDYPHFDANGEDFNRTNAAIQAAWDSMVSRGLVRHCPETVHVEGWPDVPEHFYIGLPKETP